MVAIAHACGHARNVCSGRGCGRRVSAYGKACRVIVAKSNGRGTMGMTNVWNRTKREVVELVETAQKLLRGK